MMLSRNMKIFLSFLPVLLILTGGASWYVLKVQPLQTQITKLETSLKSEQTLLGKYEKGDIQKNGEVQDTLNLQKQIPVIEGEDQFIVMLEKAEVASGSLIRNISLSNSTDTSNEQSTGTQNNPSALTSQSSGQASQSAKTGSSQTSSQTNGKQVESGAPAGLEKLTATLTVEADNYFELAAFVKKIESAERVTNVDQLQFSGTPEVTRAGEGPNKPEVLSYTLTVSTYYFPKLANLKDQAPQYDPSLPAEKKNPFYQNEVSDNNVNTSSTNIDNLGKIAQTEKYKVVVQNGATYHVYSYDVKPGDTLFHLSIKYYNNRKGEDMIKNWNGINRLEAGTTIEIPVPAGSKK